MHLPLHKITFMTHTGEISKFSRGEEMANALSHFIGFLLGITGLVLMLIRTAAHGNSLQMSTSLVFGISMVLLYLSSTMTHYLQQGKTKNIFFTLDRIAIYLLIAGTYTPIALITIGGWFGWVIFGIEWGCALLGTSLIIRKPDDFEKGVKLFFVISYAVMGWLFLVAIVPVINALPLMGWLLILIGGFLYTIGIFFYKKGKFRYHHLVWHIFVILGNAAHFASIYFYVLSAH